MGKSLISQRRGKGSPTFRAKSFTYAGVVSYAPQVDQEKTAFMTGKIMDLIHSAGHYAPLMIIEFEDKRSALLIAPEGMRVGEFIQSGLQAPAKAGNILPLQSIPEGTQICNIECRPGDGGKFVRSSGSMARVIGKTAAAVQIELPSKKIKDFHPTCRATVGSISGYARTEKPLVKAGNNFYKKRARNKMYPHVRGVAMNAVDHPFGSGRGSHKGKPTIAPRFAPPGAKVGKIRPRRTGMKR
jgi:large subunit ribosomal protein L2